MTMLTVCGTIVLTVMVPYTIATTAYIDVIMVVERFFVQHTTTSMTMMVAWIVTLHTAIPLSNWLAIARNNFVADANPVDNVLT